MRKILAFLVIAAMLSLTAVGPAAAGSATNAALALGAFAVFNQIIHGQTIFQSGYAAPAVVVAPPPVVYAPPPPPAVVYAPPPVVYAPPPPVVVYPSGYWVSGYWGHRYYRHHGWHRHDD